ncbi:hypothetical protein [Domibacillus mangrovi]|uniref:Uncharacterized protein n=1 Tax=Domibacillus mangrovi TaxID=1714354 RepID=A0A1Q5P3C2_9BACI|nr:hypothetical protein [Domibacillus mangrovi]OKL36745.1 hypothetical protein BLL40_08400 [Domibacillus mangrovi]
MNRVTGFIGASILAGGVLAGCSADSENAVPEENTAEEAVTPVETEETESTVESDVTDTDAVEQNTTETDDAVEEVPLDDGQESVDNTTTTNEEELALDAMEGKEATGTFNGLADPHTVEIEVDGVPAAYQVDPDGETMAKFAKLTEGDSVTFVYVENGEQLVINEVK